MALNRYVFMDGIIAIELKTEIVKGNPEKKKVYLCLYDWARRLAGLKREDINWESEEFSEEVHHLIAQWGWIAREIKTSDIIILSDGGEFPLRLVLTNFNGEEVNIDKSNILAIIEMKERIKALEHEANMYKELLEQAKEENKELQKGLRANIHRVKELAGISESDVVFPGEIVKEMFKKTKLVD